MSRSGNTPNSRIQLSKKEKGKGISFIFYGLTAFFFSLSLPLPDTQDSTELISAKIGQYFVVPVILWCFAYYYLSGKHAIRIEEKYAKGKKKQESITKIR